MADRLDDSILLAANKARAQFDFLIALPDGSIYTDPSLHLAHLARLLDELKENPDLTERVLWEFIDLSAKLMFLHCVWPRIGDELEDGA